MRRERCRIAADIATARGHGAMMSVIEGIVVRGYGVASGAAGDTRFPDGTIVPQLPWFRRLVPDFEAWLEGSAFPGTINLAVGNTVMIGTPEIRLEGVAWTPIFPPENFFLSRATLAHRGVRYPVFLYLPDPATKPDHVQPPDRIELIGARIPDLAYGDGVRLSYRADALTIAPGSRKAADDKVTGAP